MIGRQLLNICFHGVGARRGVLEPGESAYWIGADQFRRILDEIAAWPDVRISFDDGNESDIGIALPELTERGLTASFFPLAGRVGAAGSLTAGDLRELAAHGMTIGTHGMKHRIWRGMDSATRTSELIEAREQLAAAAGTVITEAACPLGRYDRQLLSDLRRLGYQRVYTSDRRAASPGSWLQPRFSVRDGDTAESLRAMVLARSTVTQRARLSTVGAVKRLR